MPLDRTPSAVLDTNVVLDWLVFRDPATRALERGIVTGRMRWCACPAMRAEFEQVVGRPALAQWRPDPAAAAATWACHARLQPQPTTCALSCADADDQVFIDLAVAQRCRWLISRDRALLKLARRAAAYGVSVLTPQAWAAEQSTLASAAA